MIKPHTTDHRPETLPTTIREPKRDGNFSGWARAYASKLFGIGE